MKSVSVHQILKFKQSDWLKNILDLRQVQKKILSIVLKKIFLKLMNNSVYCKTMENVRKRVKVRLVNNN